MFTALLNRFRKLAGLAPLGVEDIMASFRKNVARLEEIERDHLEHAEKQVQKILAAQEKHAASVTQAAQSARTANKLREIIGEDQVAPLEPTSLITIMKDEI